MCELRPLVALASCQICQYDMEDKSDDKVQTPASVCVVDCLQSINEQHVVRMRTSITSPSVFRMCSFVL